MPCGEDTSTVADNVDLTLSEDGVSAISDNAQEVDESALLPQERKLEASKRVAVLKAQAKIERATCGGSAIRYGAAGTGSPLHRSVSQTLALPEDGT